jgi:hypothetical protein
LNSIPHRDRRTSQLAQTPQFHTYSSVVFRSHCQEISHIYFTS